MDRAHDERGGARDSKLANRSSRKCASDSRSDRARIDVSVGEPPHQHDQHVHDSDDERGDIRDCERAAPLFE